MIPTINLLTQEIEEIEFYGRTYNIHITDESQSTSLPNSEPTGGSALGSIILGVTKLGTEPSENVSKSLNRINGFIDDLESVKQAIYLILSTERYAYVIYSWDYGIELVDLIGKPIPYCMSEIPRRVTEALLVDNRIEDVIDFEFEQKGKKLHTTFTVVTNVGNISSELEVDI